MARTVWTGAISFGLVTVPVKAYTAVREHAVHFHQLEKKTGARIRYRKVSEKTEKEVAADDIESGFEISRGNYVIVDPGEIEELRPEATRSIDITDFVKLADVDPVYYANTYWLAPDGQAAQRAYRLLLAAMEDEQRVGIGTVVMRNKQYLAAIRPMENALAMSTMHFADEVVDHSDVDGLPVRASKPESKELKLASQIITSMATDWDPTRYHDTYTEELKDLIAEKAKGNEITVEPEAPAESAKILDLAEALQASLEAARNQTTAKPSKKATQKKATKKAPAKKESAKKAPARKSA